MKHGFIPGDKPLDATDDKVLAFLLDKHTPFHSLPELEGILSSFLEHIQSNRQALIETGVCNKPFLRSPFFEQFAFVLCPLRPTKYLADRNYDGILEYRRKLYSCFIEILRFMLIRLNEKGESSILGKCFSFLRGHPLTNDDFHFILKLETSGFTEMKTYGNRRLVAGGLFDLLYLVGFIESELNYATMAPCRNRTFTLYKIRKSIKDDVIINRPFADLIESFKLKDKSNLISLFLKNHSIEELFWGPYREHIRPMKPNEDSGYIVRSFYKRVLRRLIPVSGLDSSAFEYVHEFFISPFDRFLLGVNYPDRKRLPAVTIKPTHTPPEPAHPLLEKLLLNSSDHHLSPKFKKAFLKIFEFSNDFSWVKYKNIKYDFTKTNDVAMNITKALCIAYCQGNPEIDVRPIISKAPIASRSISQIFRPLTGWQKLIKHGHRRGTYRLALPDPR